MTTELQLENNLQQHQSKKNVLRHFTIWSSWKKSPRLMTGIPGIVFPAAQLLG